MDGLRAIAAATVVAYHVCQNSGRTGNGNGFFGYGTLAPVLAELKGGVTIFFVISGLVLYLPFARAIVAGGPLPDWRTYTRRRIVRIVPAYWLAVLGVGLLLPASQTFGPNLWRLLVFAQIYHPETFFSGVGVAWSLDVEVAFYVALPFLALGIARLLRGRTGAAALSGQVLAVSALGALCLAGRLWLSHWSLMALPTAGANVRATLPPLVFGWFVPGMLLAALVAGREAGVALPRALTWLASRPGFTFLLSLAAFAVAVPTQRGDMFLTLYAPITQLLLGLGAALLVLPVALRSTANRRSALAPFDSRLLTAIGTISYGIYLWHEPLLFLLRGSELKRGPVLSIPVTFGLAVLILAGATVVAALSWKLVELPAQRLARRGERAPAGPQVAAEALAQTG